MRRAAVLFVLAGCGGNELPPQGACAVPLASGEPTVASVPLVGQAAVFDDLHYAPALGKVLAPPEGVGRLFVVDPVTHATTAIATGGGVASADADATAIYAIDRTNDRLLAYDAATGELVTSLALDGNPDYVRLTPDGGELWITIPGQDRIDVVAVTKNPLTFARVDAIAIPGAPEGLTFATSRAYTQASGRMIAIDIARKLVVGEWDTGCGVSHGFAQVDEGFGLVIAGCDAGGGAAVLAHDGELLTGYEAGGEAAVLAYDAARHHLYLRGDPGSDLKLIAVCPDGGMSVMAAVDIADEGHASTVDGRGNVWVADATTGGLLVVTDPFASTR